MPRDRPPNRRTHITTSIRWPGPESKATHVSIGLVKGKPIECFLRGGGKVRSGIDYLLDDVGVAISRLLQHGDCLQSIALGLARSPTGAPMSVVGAALDAMLSMEKDLNQ